MTQLVLFSAPPAADNDLFVPHVPFADCRVPADSVQDFLRRYYRGDRLQGIERDLPGYVATVTAYHQRYYAEQGYCIISRHESATGQTVAWPPLD